MAELIQLTDPETAVSLRRASRARRLTLTVPPNGDLPRLTAPHSASDADIRMFLMRQADWLRAALERMPGCIQVTDGARVPVAGRMLTITRADGRRCPPMIDGDALILQGAGAAGPRIAAWLKERARAETALIADACAAQIGKKRGRITLRDPRGRWGSCTSRGDLMFSWRLAMAPPEALDYVAAHEVAHLAEMNHGPRFWALVEHLRPGWRQWRDWLRREGNSLHRYRFDG